jgi:hypothetical protein
VALAIAHEVCGRLTSARPPTVKDGYDHRQPQSSSLVKKSLFDKAASVAMMMVMMMTSIAVSPSIVGITAIVNAESV